MEDGHLLGGKRQLREQRVVGEKGGRGLKASDVVVDIGKWQINKTSSLRAVI